MLSMSLRRLFSLFCMSICVTEAGNYDKTSVTIPLDAGFDTSKWRVHNANHSFDLVAAVPGGVHTALLRNAIIGDPYFRFRDVEYRWIAYDSWTFYRNFTLYSDVFDRNSVVLVADGLDTITNVSVNGVLVGQSDNMFIRHEWSIKPLIKKGSNNITVSFGAAPTFAAERYDGYSYDVPPDCPAKVQNGICHVNFVRKEQSSFSWDWGPAFAPQGIWKNLTVRAFDAAIIQDVLAVPLPNEDLTSWKLNVTVFFSVGTLPANESASGHISVALPFAAVEDVPIKLTRGEPVYNVVLADIVLKPEYLWWPNGFGNQTLYQLNVTFSNSQFQTLSNKSIRVGFRSVQLVQEEVPKSSGLSFYFKINGRPIFIKGSNWIPADALQERVDPGRLRGLLRSATEANMHALRVWGGGVYEQDAFYDTCDELGVVLWQDVMFGCSMYPADGGSLASVRREVEQQVRRIGHHPSLLIWAGNNENEVALRQNWYGTAKNFTLYEADYVKLYIDTIREEVLHHATNIPFVSSSPSNGVETESSGWVAANPYDTHYGDVHYYNYVDDCWDTSHFPKTRFASEYGFQSWPSLESLKRVSVRDDWDMGSNFSNHRQHHENGNIQMLDMILKHFNRSERTNSTEEAFHDMIYLTQISQALCIKLQTEHYRRLQSLVVDGEGHCMGALYWQLNDIWQAPTWASIEYGGGWKMLHYSAKDFFAPVLASGVEGSDGRLCVYSVTDAEDLHGASLVVTLRKWSSMSFGYSWRTNFSQSSPSSLLVFQKDMKKLLQEGKCDDRNGCFLTFQIFRRGKLISPTNLFFLASFKNAVGLKRAVVTVGEIVQKTKDCFSVELQTTAIAPFTWLEVAKLPPVPENNSLSFGRFSDNGFTLLEPAKEVEFYAWQDISLKDFTESLRVTTLTDLYSSDREEH